MKLLLVEDEEFLGAFEAQALVEAGMLVDWVRSGSKALEMAASADYGCILLDLGLPDVDGASVIKRLRAAGQDAPIIVLTARSGTADIVTMLDLGADDYVVKPFDVPELKARIRAMQRRPLKSNENDLHQVGPLQLQRSSRTTHWHGRPVVLTNKEFDLLETLVTRRPSTLSRRELQAVIYGQGAEVESNSIEVFVHSLRRKFSPRLVMTTRGLGYRLGSEAVLHAEDPRN